MPRLRGCLVQKTDPHELKTVFTTPQARPHHRLSAPALLLSAPAKNSHLHSRLRTL